MEEFVAIFNHEQRPEEYVEPRRASSPALEDKLLKLAHGVHQGAPLRSVLDWNAPDNVPDLALNALLHLNGTRFAELSPEARTRRFKALPDDPEALKESNSAALTFASRIVRATGDIAASLTPEERSLLEARLRVMADGPETRSWRWLIFVSFFATGADHLEDEARALTTEHVGEALAAFAVGRLLLGVAARDPARVEPTLHAILAAARERAPKAEVPLAVGALGRLLVHGAPPGQEAAAALLLRLAERDPFRDDPRMSELIGFFGLEKEARA